MPNIITLTDRLKRTCKQLNRVAHAPNAVEAVCSMTQGKELRFGFEYTRQDGSRHKEMRRVENLSDSVVANMQINNGVCGVTHVIIKLLTEDLHKRYAEIYEANRLDLLADILEAGAIVSAKTVCSIRSRQQLPSIDLNDLCEDSDDITRTDLVFRQTGHVRALITDSIIPIKGTQSSINAFKENWCRIIYGRRPMF